MKGKKPTTKVEAEVEAVVTPVAAEVVKTESVKTEVVHPLTEEAYQYYTASGEARKRWPFRMYLPQNRLEEIFKVLCEMGDGKAESLTKAEVALLVYEDAGLQDCAACGEKFQPVAVVAIRNLDDPEIREEVKKGSAEHKADEKVYGRLAPFVHVSESVDGAYRPEVDGSILPVLGKGWERHAFCGPFWWFNTRTNELVLNRDSHIVIARFQMKEALGLPRLPNTFATVSVDWVIQRRERNHEEKKAERDQLYAERNAKRENVASGISDFFDARRRARKAAIAAERADRYAKGDFGGGRSRDRRDRR